MASGSTPLRGRPYPNESDTPDVAADIESLAVSLDNCPNVTQGTLASRPTTAVPGDRYYVTGDGSSTNNGIEWLCVAAPNTWIQISQAPPLGSMTEYAGSSDPSDTRWLLCDGRAISRTNYAALFAIVGTTWGGGDGSTTFNIPDRRGRVGVGVDPTGLRLPSAKPGLAAVGGEEKHALTTGEMPSHSHDTVDNGGRVPVSTVGWSAVDVTVSGATPVASPSSGFSSRTTTGTAGSGTAHNILQPYVAVNHIIRVS